MHQFKAAQPALLYLSPACILSVTFTALVRGELQTFWKYTDEDEEAQIKAKEESTSKLDKSDKSNGHGVDVATSTAIDSSVNVSETVKRR